MIHKALSPGEVDWLPSVILLRVYCIVIHGGQFTGGVHPPNQFVHEIVSPLPYSPALVCHKLLIVYFFKELISFIGSLDKCHTRVFNALIPLAIRVLPNHRNIHTERRFASPRGNAWRET